MPINIFSKDGLRSAVETSSDGKNTVLYDGNGVPSYMYILKKFNIEDKNYNKRTIKNIGLDTENGLAYIEIDNPYVSQGIRVFNPGNSVYIYPPRKPITSSYDIYNIDDIFDIDSSYTIVNTGSDYFTIDISSLSLNSSEYKFFGTESVVLDSEHMGTGTHPAFTYYDSNGDLQERDVIFIGMYQSSFAYNTIPWSFPGRVPTYRTSYSDASNYSSAKGTGWHLMTNWEYSAIILDGLASGHYPIGNTSSGRSAQYTGRGKEIKNYNSVLSENSRRYYGYRLDGEDAFDIGTSGSYYDNVTYTGSGSSEWRHDGTFSGVSDLIGNINEHVGGMSSLNGVLYIPDTNVTTDIEATPATGIISSVVFAPPETNRSTYPYLQAVGEESTWTTSTIQPPSPNFEQVQLSAGYQALSTSIKYKMMQALIDPTPHQKYPLESGVMGICQGGVRYAVRGGYFGSPYAGMFELNFRSTSTAEFAATGFRLAYTG